MLADADAHTDRDAHADSDRDSRHAAPLDAAGHGLERTTQTTIGVRWNAATDNRGVVGYRLYRNNVAVGTTTNLSYTVSGLECGTGYTIGLTAYDAAGNESIRAEATGTTSTQPCAEPEPEPEPEPDSLLGPDPLPGPRRGLELRRGERDLRLRRLGVGQRRHDLRGHAHREREVRRRAAVRRGRRLRHDPR